MTEVALNNFLKSGKCSDAIEVMIQTKKDNLHDVTIELGKFFNNIFPKNAYILYNMSESYFLLKKYKECYDSLLKIVKEININEGFLRDVGNLQAKCISYMENDYDYYNEEIVKKIYNRKRTEFPLITLTMTTCKRYELFEKTINTFLNCCLDIDKIDKWFCIDDNSSEEDRKRMKEKYPFFEFYFKNFSEKGHPQSMNIILKSVKTPYIFHLEDDWKFFYPRNYITDLLCVLNESDIFGQCLVNKNYTEISKDYNTIIGGEFHRTASGIYYFIHEYCKSQEEWDKFYSKHGRGSNSAYWKHFSLRPSLIKRSVFEKLGLFDEKVSHFESEYSNKYINAGYVSTFLDCIYSIHTGRLTSEISDNTKINAYTLNGEKQFSGKEVVYKPKTYVINLDRRTDRLEKFRKMAETICLEYDRFPAIDGSSLIPNQQLQRIFENNDYNMREGMVGCALSHIKLWIELVNSSCDFFCIFEDDIEFVSEFNEKLQVVYRDLPDGWDLCYLGHHLKDKYKSDEYYDKKSFPKLEKWNSEKSLTYSLGGTGGYIISKKGALGLLNFINNKGMTNGIDTVQQKAADNINVYYCKPHLIYSECCNLNKNSDTDIQYNFKSLNYNGIINLEKYPERLIKNGVFNIDDALESYNKRYIISCSETTHASEAINKNEYQKEKFPFDLTDGGRIEDFSDIIKKIVEYSDKELEEFCEEFCSNNKYGILFPHERDNIKLLYIEKFKNLRNVIKSKSELIFIHVSRWKRSTESIFIDFIEFLSKYNKNVKLLTVNGSCNIKHRLITTVELDFPAKYHNDNWYYEKILFDQNIFRVELISVIKKYLEK